MDILAHALYGVVLCSDYAGSPEERKLVRRQRLAAVGFGVLPDVFSMWPAFVRHMATYGNDNFFAAYGGYDLVIYRLMHSLVISLLFCLALRFCLGRFFLPSLAWPLHVCCDMFTHGASKFRTTIFYPFSSWGFDGIRWWEEPLVILSYWVLLGGIWLTKQSVLRHRRMLTHI